MIKKILLILLISLLFFACSSNKIKFSEEVDADVIGFTNKSIGLKYDLYGTTVFQDVLLSSLAEFSFFTKMKQIPLTVLVEADDFEGGDRVYITLFYKGSQFYEKTHMEDLSAKPFMAQDMKIPTFKWYMFNDKEYSEGITPQQLRAKLEEEGKETPEAVVKKEEKKKEEKKSL